MFRSGYISIVGSPNVGKSTLHNQLLGEKVSIVTKKPQTTRHRILGILNRPQAQIIFLDTPGIHNSSKLLNEEIVETALGTLSEADVLVHMILPGKKINEVDHGIAKRIRKTGKPYWVVINKIDLFPKEGLLPMIDQIRTEWAPQEIFPVSALSGDGLEGFIKKLEASLPEGPPYFSKDLYTEQDVRFFCGEIVREKAMQLLHEEIPYSLVTQVENYQESEKLDRIGVVIIVEKPSQKGMVIGAQGKMIKKIGHLARKDIEKMVGKKVYLELFVKVVKGWTQDKNKLREFGIVERK